jgi:hypothetical protein
MLKLLLPKSIRRPTSRISTHKHSEKEWYLPWITYFLVSFRIPNHSWENHQHLIKSMHWRQYRWSRWLKDLKVTRSLYKPMPVLIGVSWKDSRMSTRPRQAAENRFCSSQWENLGTDNETMVQEDLCERRWEKGQQSQISLEESSEMASGE